MYLVCPYTTTTVNAEVSALLNDTVGRWSPVNQCYGIALNCVRGSMSALTTYGASVGATKHVATLGILDSQTPIFESAAIFGGLVAATSNSNVALPIVGPLEGLDAPSITQRLRRVDENTLLYSGISAIRVDASGLPNLSRAVQNYQTDENYLSIETDLMVAFVDQYIRRGLESTYKQCSLLIDGSPVQAGSGATTSQLILGHVYGIYLSLEDQGVVQDSKTFIAGAYAEANIQEGVVALYLPVTTAGLLRVIRVLNAFS
jgi:phage tail sheath gpL-like